MMDREDDSKINLEWWIEINIKEMRFDKVYQLHNYQRARNPILEIFELRDMINVYRITKFFSNQVYPNQMTS
jgi:hypothetical protein